MPVTLEKRQGEIQVREDLKFRWTMTGTTHPEIYGWLERNHDMISGSSGFYRTPDPEEAAKRAEIIFNNELGG